MKSVVRYRKYILSSAGFASFFFCLPGANAQNVSAAMPSAAVDDIIVTARKREETSLQTPVVVTALGAAQLERRGIVNMDSLARAVPQLVIGNSGASVQGGAVTLRGLGSAEGNPFQDQSVAFNIDGVQVAKAAVRRMSETDIAQIEVLKGPQALFFGKNSPAGIISIRTADPTDRLEAKISAGYEFEAREIRTEGYVSTPVTDTLGVRVAGYFSHMDGWMEEDTPDGSVAKMRDGRVARSRDYAVRGTLKWEPTDRFSARFKINQGRTSNDGPGVTRVYVNCPTGARQSGSGGPCTVGNRVRGTGLGPVLGTLGGTIDLFGDGDSFQKQKQFLSSLEMNYDVTDDIRLTSVTGYYDVKLRQCWNALADDRNVLANCNLLDNREFSQELRIATDYDGPLNFTAGAFFADTHATTGSVANIFKTVGQFPFGGTLNSPTLLADYYLVQDGQAYSAFIQGSYKPVEQVEITAGVRYSNEKKKLPLVKSGGGLNDGKLPGTRILDDSTIIVPRIRSRTWSDYSPEVTVAYRPTSNLNLFASYKHGFLSGGFNAGSVNFTVNPDLSYNPQTIKGFEGGLKAALLNGALRVNVSAYDYRISSLQVTQLENAVQTIRNAGSARVKGVEGDFTYRTPLEGFSLRGQAAYNRGRYVSFVDAPCVSGQTPAQGCNGKFSATANNGLGGFTSQDLSGTPLPRAPEWVLGGGATFETPLGDALKLSLSGDVSYSSRYFTDTSSNPAGVQKGYTLIDATLNLGDRNDAWSVGLVGRNLTNKYYFVASGTAPFSGARTGLATAVAADTYANVNRGREIMVRATYRFGN